MQEAKHEQNSSMMVSLRITLVLLMLCQPADNSSLWHDTVHHSASAFLGIHYIGGNIYYVYSNHYNLAKLQILLAPLGMNYIFFRQQ